MTVNYHPRFAELLDYYLTRSERSGTWLAERLAMNPSAVTRWRNGTSRPNSPELIIRIADVLGITNEEERRQLLAAAGYAAILNPSAPMVEQERFLPGNATAEPTEPDAASAISTAPITAKATITPPVASPVTPPTIPAPNDLSAQSTPPLLSAETARRARWSLMPLRQALAAGWRANAAFQWASVAGLGLLLLLGLGYFLLWEWPGIRQSSYGALLLIALAGLWQAVRQWEQMNAWLLRSFASRRAYIGAASLLAVSVGLWATLGLPKYLGRWAYPDRSENDDYFGHALVSGDFDGNGDVELAISAVGEAPTFAARLRSGWLYHFGHDGYETLLPGLNLGQAGFDWNEEGDRFGWALARGDFNGDGLTDLAVGTPGKTIGTARQSGIVYVFRGTPTGLRPWRAIDQQLLGSNESNDGFGWALVAADFNRDGNDDLAIGVPNEQPGIVPRSGYVFIFTGQSYGFQQWFGIRQEGLEVDEDGDRFGWALAAGDFNRDGLIELAVGAPGDRADDQPAAGVMGQVFLFQCDPSRGPQPWRVLTPPVGDAAISADGFGAALTVGDFTGDGVADLAVGAPGLAPAESASRPVAGAVYLWQGEADGLRLWDIATAQAFTATQPGARFGWSLVSADFDQDTDADLAVGAPYQQSEAQDGRPRGGAVFTFQSNGGKLTPWDLLQEPLLARGQAEDAFGWAMTTLDVNGDQRAELAISAPGTPAHEGWVAGNVYTFRFAPGGFVGAQGLQQ